jgi:hypothetical protein
MGSFYFHSPPPLTSRNVNLYQFSSICSVRTACQLSLSSFMDMQTGFSLFPVTLSSSSAAIPQFTMNLYDLNGKNAATWNIPIFEQNGLNDHSYENGYAYKRTAKVRLPFLKSGLYLFDAATVRAVTLTIFLQVLFHFLLQDVP